jgi:hypothetical protein
MNRDEILAIAEESGLHHAGITYAAAIRKSEG